ncbi:MAG: hypothetical protein IPF92_18805 [Myxococcales bacterium]|nr:hypothetical protein [Myxococcales bacterium]MBL0194229.1 hypothetical protein [Myxococcales bacterium]HQY62383.1 hypothetical protein [Polyangiaceae bacterium]
MRPLVLALLLSASAAPALTLGATGCAGQSRPARMREAASELNLNARFGRMEMASEHVAPEAREAFFKRRSVWGGRVRIVDSELVGIRFEKDDSEARATVAVAWQPVDDGDLRTTTVTQTFKDKRNGWLLVSEEVAGGDVGLFGGKAAAPKDVPKSAPRKNQFDTIRLGQGEPTKPSGDDSAP